MAKVGRPKKSEFDMLDSDTQDEIASMDREQLKDYLAKVAMDTANLQKMQEEDQDLKEKKAAASEAGVIYRDGKKRNYQRVKLAMRVLGDKGGDTEPDGEASSLS